jgi:hypothetical protein
MCDPQLGQAAAESEISLLQSLQLIKAMRDHPPQIIVVLERF